ERKLRKSPRDVNATYGPPELCAWEVEPGVFWIQTSGPEFSRKLEKRQDARRVEVNGVNHFRRTFEVRGTWRKIRRIIDRYLESLGDPSAPDQVSSHFWLQRASKSHGSIGVAAGSNRCRKAVLLPEGSRAS